MRIESPHLPKLSIAMLCGSGSVKHDTMNSLIMSMQHLQSVGVVYDYITLQGVTGIDSARNLITDMFLQRDFTHMLMIDDDMAWSADLPFRMLRENLEILGVPYKRKRVKNCRWTVNHPVPDVALMDGKPYLMRVDSIATGMMMVRRSTFEKLAPFTERAIISEDKPPINLYFRHTIGSNGKLRSEDFSFCELARSNGIDVWAWTDEDIAHIGDYAYTGNYNTDIVQLGEYDGPREPLRVMLK